MLLRPEIRRFARAWAPVALLSLLVLAGCAKDYPQTTLAPKGDFAHIVDGVFWTTFKWAIAVFILVQGALVYAIIRFRARPGAPEPEQHHGNTALEIVWTIIPAAILAFIAVPTVKAIFRTAKEPGAEAVQIEVIGHQWWWEFRYPDLKIVTAGDLHVPMGQTVNLRMTTGDVLHSFWVPQFAGKRDVFPRRYNNIWFKAETTGVFTGQCAEFCGTEHARMAFRVVSETPDEFKKWADQQTVGSPMVNGGQVSDSALSASIKAATGDTSSHVDSVLAKGKEAFMAGGCIGCHAMVGTPMAGMTALVGPNLSHVGSRHTIAAGTLPLNEENLTRWLHNPDEVKPGVLMKLPRALTDDEVKTLVAYLQLHK
ncbi:MAG TPA: cytochrome c oxidase subunit II [Gemmatimonadales bacterium]|nr:cytochrome c oxidase subunit II [Gemmatimonadales bacterium]